MKRMILTLDLEAAGEEAAEEGLEEGLVEELLEGEGFVAAVETDEGTLTLLPSNTFYGEFPDDAVAGDLADKLEDAFSDSGLEISSLLITEMGADQVLIGEEVEEEEEGGAQA